MWKHCDTNDNNKYSLHDCKATESYIDGEDLVFVFEDGFWVINEDNGAYRTDKAEIRIKNYDIRSIWLFHKIWRKKMFSLRTNLEIKKLIKEINSGKQLEFINEYHTYRCVLWECWIWFERKPYHKELDMAIDNDGITYCWNNIREDRPW